MLSNYRTYLLIVLAALAMVGCKKDDKAMLWGKTQCYDKFLWVHHTPDTLKQTLCFDFNGDAKDFMTDNLQLGIFEKNDRGEFVRMEENEAEVFANGQKAERNIISVPPTCSEMEVGIVFNKDAENKTHYWYIRSVNNGGLDRINDREPAALEDDAIIEMRLQKEHIMNPLAEGLLMFLIVVVAALLVWLLVLKHLFFPTFKVNKLELIGPEPYLNTIKLKRYRKIVLTSKSKRQSGWSSVFTGEIKYSINPLWTADVEFEPKDKRSIRIRPDRSTYITDARIMKRDEEYTLENTTTHAKTRLKIS